LLDVHCDTMLLVSDLAVLLNNRTPDFVISKVEVLYYLLEVASLMVDSVFVKYCKFNLVSLYRSGFAAESERRTDSSLSKFSD
jgi:hypothetical protein